jgi:Flp pilus assembly protein TadB
MVENRVLFDIGGKPWTLGGVYMVLALALLVIGGSLFAVLLVRHGETRRLEGREASRVAFNADRLGGELRPIHGPAIGVERRMSFTIGDLRRARQAGDNLVFWGVPAFMTTLSAGFGCLCLGGAVLTNTPVFLVGFIVLVPMFLIACFMPWAAVHTQLE